jgi:hypothetical protein
MWMAGPGSEKQTNRYGRGHAYKISKIEISGFDLSHYRRLEIPSSD